MMNSVETGQKYLGGSLLTRVRAMRHGVVMESLGGLKILLRAYFALRWIDISLDIGLYLLYHGGWLFGPNNAFREPINTYLLSDPIDRGEHDLLSHFPLRALLALAPAPAVN